MYKMSTTTKSLLAGAVLSLALLSTSVLAGPGKPGKNLVKPGGNIVAVDMLAGGYITATPTPSIIDGVPQVINPVTPLININASNGVIHVIDTVLLPFNTFAGI